MKGRKDRDEDLLLFKELRKREKDRLASLLQPVSDEFEPTGGNHALYKITSYGKKESAGYAFFGESDKNDYDWLTTPPATPLFPSLEMEAANAPQLVLQREIPIVQSFLSRFANSTEASKGSSGTPKSPNSKPKIPMRSATPACQRPSLNQRISPHLNRSRHNQKETQINSPAKSVMDSKAEPTTSTVSPPVIKHAQILGLSNDTLPNLRTDRATSATRCRPLSSNTTLSIQHKSKRQSCSPSVIRGRKESAEGNVTIQKAKFQSGSINNNIINNGTQLFGSTMVDKVMNARKLGAEGKEAKLKHAATNACNKGSTTRGFGSMGSKTSLDQSLKYMEIKRDRVNPRQLGKKATQK